MTHQALASTKLWLEQEQDCVHITMPHWINKKLTGEVEMHFFACGDSRNIHNHKRQDTTVSIEHQTLCFKTQIKL